VATASLYMEGHAALWLHAQKQRLQITSWLQFCRDLKQEFGQDEYDVPMSRLLQLKQTGSISEYRQAFESIMYHLMTLESRINKFFVKAKHCSGCGLGTDSRGN
jgi:hypothetical protein